MLLDIPDATTTLAGVAQVSVPWFDAFLPYVGISTGIFIGVGVVIFLRNIFLNWIHPDYYSERDRLIDIINKDTELGKDWFIWKTAQEGRGWPNKKGKYYG